MLTNSPVIFTCFEQLPDPRNPGGNCQHLLHEIVPARQQPHRNHAASRETSSGLLQLSKSAILFWDFGHTCESRLSRLLVTNPYQILGVDSTANADEIRSAYLRLASLHHPDKGGEAAKFQEVAAAYQQLSVAPPQAANKPLRTPGKKKSEPPPSNPSPLDSRLRLPAICLLVVTVPWLCLLRYLGEPHFLIEKIYFVSGFVGLFGCVSMLRYKHRWLAITGAICAALASPCLVGIPFAGWAIYLLTEHDVAARFRHRS